MNVRWSCKLIFPESLLVRNYENESVSFCAPQCSGTSISFFVYNTQFKKAVILLLFPLFFK